MTHISLKRVNGLLIHFFLATENVHQQDVAYSGEQRRAEVERCIADDLVIVWCTVLEPRRIKAITTIVTDCCYQTSRSVHYQSDVWPHLYHYQTTIGTS